MQFNVTKCHTMRISRKKDPVLMDYYIDGQKLSPVNNHPYLGVMLSNDPRWNSQGEIASIEAVQRRAARFIKRDYNRTSSVTEMLQSLDLDLLEDRRKAHRLNIFYLAVNNSIALSIPYYFFT